MNSEVLDLDEGVKGKLGVSDAVRDFVAGMREKEKNGLSFVVNGVFEYCGKHGISAYAALERGRGARWMCLKIRVSTRTPRSERKLLASRVAHLTSGVRCVAEVVVVERESVQSRLF